MGQVHVLNLRTEGGGDRGVPSPVAARDLRANCIYSQFIEEIQQRNSENKFYSFFFNFPIAPCDLQGNCILKEFIFIN